MRSFVVALTCLSVVSLSFRARADEASVDPAADEPPVGLGLALGSATALVPFATGVTIMVTTESRDVTLGGLFVGEAGLVLAPLVGHGAVGEWTRGLRFALYPAIGATFLAGLVVARPSIVTSGLSTPLQYAFVLGVGETLFASSIGVWDVTGAKARHDKATTVHVVPYTGKGEAGLRLAGTF